MHYSYWLKIADTTVRMTADDVFISQILFNVGSFNDKKVTFNEISLASEALGDSVTNE